MSKPADPERYLSDPPPPYSSVVHTRCQNLAYPIPEIRVNGIPVIRSPIVPPLSNRTSASFNHVGEPLSVICEPKTTATNRITTRTRCLLTFLCCGASIILMLVILILEGSVFRIPK